MRERSRRGVFTRRSVDVPRPDAQRVYSLGPRLTDDAVRALRAVGSIERLSIGRGRLLTAKRARRLLELPPTRWLWLWRDATRAAIRRIVRIPELETLDVLSLCGPGALSGLQHATGLRTLRINGGLHARDLRGIAQCPSLEELGAQGAELTHRALDALLSVPRLRSLDLEGTRFDDTMAERLTDAPALECLEIGATRVTCAGLAQLSRIERLRGLDLWATPLREDDYELLHRFPALEYVSLGGYDDAPLDGKIIVPLLLALPAMKRVWLDGVTLDRDQIAALEARFESVRIT